MTAASARTGIQRALIAAAVILALAAPPARAAGAGPAPTAGAQAHASSFEFHAPTGPVSIGMPLELEGTARFSERFSLSFDPAGQSTKAVTILDVLTLPAETRGGMREQRVRLKIAAFELGSVTLPALSWMLSSLDGSKEVLRSPPVRFECVGPTPGPKDTNDIRDIRGPLAAPWWIFALPAAVLAFAGAAAALRWRRRAGKDARGQAAEDRRLPHERALDELRLLYQSELPVKDFYIRLTDILRAYFESRFGIAAGVLTTSDILRQLREVEIARPLVARCRDVFEHADLVKFARWVPVPDEIRRDWSEAEHVVRSTASPPPAPSPTALESPAAPR